MGRTGRGFDTCCTDTPADDVLLSLEEDDDDEEGSCVAEERSSNGCTGLGSEVWRLNVSPRSVPQFVVSV